MKFVHISDLHLGKKTDGYSLFEDQRHILNQIADISKEESADAVMIAGDIYDNSRPSADAVVLFNEFLTKLNNYKIKIYAVSGNHDCGERIDYGNKIFEKNGLYFCGVYDGKLKKEIFKDEYGYVNIYMLPFVTHYHVNSFINNDEKKVKDYNEAVKYIIDNSDINFNERNIIIAHQLVFDSGKMPVISESERLIVGTLDNISSVNFKNFDYTALGHIHSMQKMSKTSDIWYSGAPLKYSFSTEDTDKKIIIVNLKEKGNISVDSLPLTPLKEMTVIEKQFEEMLSDKKNENYIKAVITNAEPIDNAYSRLKNVYPNLMNVTYKNRKNIFLDNIKFDEIKGKTDTELFADFYEKINGTELDEEMKEIVKRVFSDSDGGGENETDFA